MKKLIMTIGLLAAMTAWVAAQTSCESGDCSCASCAAEPTVLPALQGLDQDLIAEEHVEEAEHDDHEGHDHDAEDHSGHDHGTEAAEHDEHAGCDHAVEEAEHDGHEGHDHDAEDHSGHDHGAEVAVVDEHAGHDHGAEEGGLEISAEMAQKVGLKIHAAQSGKISKSVVFPAEILLNRDRTAAVSPRFASIVRQVFVEIGDSVKKGDILASLENRESMAVYTISAPLDGLILTKNLAVGESANEDRVLFEVGDLSTVWADISIFPQYQHLLRKGMPVKFIAHDGHTAKGTVKFISPIVSQETRTFTARCVLVGADEDFTPGAFVRALINTETMDARVRVEREAVQKVDGESVIFIPTDHGFEARPVFLGMSDDFAVEITNGLKPGESYVAAGAFALKAEMVTSGLDPHAGHGH